jgi:hypothetical protein
MSQLRCYSPVPNPISRLISALIVVTLLLTIPATHSVIAQEETSPESSISGDTDAAPQPELEQPLIEPVATATLPPIMPEAAETPTSTTVVTFPTRKGPRSADDLAIELAHAGYPGPWDVPSMLAAYDRATTPTATPMPTARQSTVRTAWQRPSDPACTPAFATAPWCEWVSSRRHLLTDLIIFDQAGHPFALYSGDDVQLGTVSLDSKGQPWVRILPASTGGWGLLYLPADTVRSLDSQAS